MLESPLGALHTLIVQYLYIIIILILQALSSWLLIIARQPFSSLAIDFQADFKSKLTRPLMDIQCRLGKQLQCRFGIGI